MINIVQLGIGNVTSIGNWARQYTDDITLLTSPDNYTSGHLIIPGVCSSAELAKLLKVAGFDGFLESLVGHPTTKIIGVCAGFQVLGESTDEDGGAPCLGLIPVSTVSMRTLGLPSVVGWDSVRIEMPIKKESLLRRSFPRHKALSGDAFFNHRYGVIPKTGNENPESAGKARHCVTHWFDRNIFGLQFHPEKSSVFGRRLLGLLS